MYRCIDMHEEDAQYFWRDEKGFIKEYFL